MEAHFGTLDPVNDLSKNEGRKKQSSRGPRRSFLEASALSPPVFLSSALSDIFFNPTINETNTPFPLTSTIPDHDDIFHERATDAGQVVTRCYAVLRARVTAGSYPDERKTLPRAMDASKREKKEKGNGNWSKKVTGGGGASLRDPRSSVENRRPSPTRLYLCNCPLLRSNRWNQLFRGAPVPAETFAIRVTQLSPPANSRRKNSCPRIPRLPCP